MFDTMHRESSSMLISPTFSENPLLKRSKSIPIKDSSRCQNLIGAEHDEQLDTDWRDYVVFHRIATGITKMQQGTTSATSRQVNDMCLASIIGTRNLSDDELMQGADRSDESWLPTNSKDFAVQEEPTSSLRSMLLRSYGRHDNLYCLSSLPEPRHPDRRSSPGAPAPTSLEDEAIFDLEL